ncbi:hypothetical protein MMC30_005575 [Trapelia coarctata]|nr:hypothetical protein [Trapelia coarctata]
MKEHIHFRTIHATCMGGILPLKSLRLPLYFWITGTLLLAIYDEDQLVRAHETLEHEESEARERNMLAEHHPSEQSKALEEPISTWKDIHDASLRSTTARQRRQFILGTLDWMSIYGMPTGATIQSAKVGRRRTTTKNPGQDSGSRLPHAYFMGINKGWEPISGVL